jgi:glycosyltransferase involved in cell wall biosynthesis
MSLSSADVLFVSKGTGVVPWYRCGMPAFYLGCDWVGVTGDNPRTLALQTGMKRGGMNIPRFEDYKIVILQQVKGRSWMQEILRLKKRGVIVLYEVDDYLHGVRKIQSHRAKDAYKKKTLADYELCMRVSSGMICSTQWLANHYRKYNRNVFVCKNGIEGRRYSQFELPKRDTINIGWAGGEGHLESVRAWLPAVESVLNAYDNARFITIGKGVADLLDRPNQCLALPWVSIENFAAALCNFDVAIAPAGRSSFFAAKSDLRFLETGALGIPLIADPFVYDDIEDYGTGLLADDLAQAEHHLFALMASSEFRQEIGGAARAYVLGNRIIEKAVEQWERVFVNVVNRMAA